MTENYNLLLVEDKESNEVLINHIAEDLKHTNGANINLTRIDRNKCICDTHYDIILHGYKSLQMIHSLSLYDHLTGLYNRKGFFHLIERQMKLSVRRRENFLLIYIDIDNFKKLNDTYGHMVGDSMLVRVANILRLSFRDSDIIARIGGDEFVVFPAEWSNKRDIINRIKERTDADNNRDNRHAISFSIGIVNCKPEDNNSIDELLHKADSAMYRDKRGKARHGQEVMR